MIGCSAGQHNGEPAPVVAHVHHAGTVEYACAACLPGHMGWLVHRALLDGPHVAVVQQPAVIVIQRTRDAAA